jgi:putative transport protein
MIVDGFRELLAGNPVLLLFLVLAIGFVIGRIRFGPVQLGSVAGVLLAGLLLGHFGFEGNAAIQSLGFVLFIFSVGYEAGPKFVQAVRKDGRRYLAIAIVVAVSGFGLAYGLARTFDLAPGASAGVLAGALTSTPTLAAADDAVQMEGYVPPGNASAETVRANITTAYAITYVFGLVGLILIIRLLPGWLKIDLATEAKKLEQEDAATIAPPVFSPSDLVVRAVRVEAEEFTHRPLKEIYQSVPMQFTVLKIRRNGELFEPDGDTELQIGDVVSIVGVMNPEALEQMANTVLGSQSRDRELLQFQTESVRICVTRKDAAGVTLGDLEIPQRNASFVSRIERMGVTLDVSPTKKLERGDVLHVTGPSAGLEALGSRLGHLERDVEETDLRTFSWAIVFGILLGTWSLNVAGVAIGLGSAGGLLTLGLLVGYFRSLFPVFGRVPAGARWIFTELGLLLFMAGVGLRGGAGLIETLQTSGVALVFIGVTVTVVPLAIAYVYGRKVLHMNPLMLLGAITGAMTSGGALSVINDQSRSTIAGIGYTGAYAFANVLLTLAGAVIVRL